MTQQLAAASVSRTKLIAVGGLAVVFVGVLYFRLSESADDATPVETAAYVPPSPSAPNIAPNVASAVAPIATPKSEARLIAAGTQQNLPAVDVRRLLASNPFHTGAAIKDDGRPDETDSEVSDEPKTFVRFLGSLFGETAASGKRSSPASGKEATLDGNRTVADDSPAEDEAPKVVVSAIVTGGNRPTAMIGDTLYFENDRLGDKWRIVAIRPTGIVVRADD